MRENGTRCIIKNGITTDSMYIYYTITTPIVVYKTQICVDLRRFCKNAVFD